MAKQIVDMPMTDIAFASRKFAMPVDTTESTRAERTANVGIPASFKRPRSKRANVYRHIGSEMDEECVGSTYCHTQAQETKTDRCSGTNRPVMNVLVATASVHTTATAGDYLDGRVSADDTVYILTVEEPDRDPRDTGDAANVARVRLLEPTVESLRKSGEPADAIINAVVEHDIDEIVLGERSGDPERAGTPPGSTVQTLLADLPIPATILPQQTPN